MASPFRSVPPPGIAVTIELRFRCSAAWGAIHTDEPRPIGELIALVNSGQLDLN